LTTIFKIKPLLSILRTVSRRIFLAVKASNPEPKTELLDMNKNLKEKLPRC
jgi:hypothetical protein